MDARRDDAAQRGPRDDNARDDLAHEEWWAALSLEERYQAIEMVRLEQKPDRPWQGDLPTGDRAAWVRARPEYRERFAGADNIARQDDPGFGPDPVPGSHQRTRPLEGDGSPEPGSSTHDHGPAHGLERGTERADGV